MTSLTVSGTLVGEKEMDAAVTQPRSLEGPITAPPTFWTRVNSIMPGCYLVASISDLYCGVPVVILKTK